MGCRRCCARPPEHRLQLFWLPGLSAKECGWRALPARHAGALPARGCVRGQPRGAGGGGGERRPPLRPGEVLFLGSRAGATALPAPSAPACKSGRDDKWRRGIWAGSRRRCRAGAVLSLRQSHPEQRRDTQEPWSRGKGTGWMVLGSSDHQMCLGQT